MSPCSLPGCGCPSQCVESQLSTPLILWLQSPSFSRSRGVEFRMIFKREWDFHRRNSPVDLRAGNTSGGHTTPHQREERHNPVQHRACLGYFGCLDLKYPILAPTRAEHRAGKMVKCGGIAACCPTINSWRGAGSTEEGWSLDGLQHPAELPPT